MHEQSEIISDLQIIKTLLNSYTAALQKVTGEARLLAEKIEFEESKLSTSQSEVDLNVLYRQSSEGRVALQKKLMLVSVLRALVKRNTQRLNQLLGETGTKEEEVKPLTKKVMSELTEGAEEPTADSIGFGENSGVIEDFNGHKLLIAGGVISGEDERNLEELKSMSFDELEQLVFAYPAVMSTIPVTELLDGAFRNKLIKQTISFIFEKLKENTETEVNEMLGSPLVLKYEIPDSFGSFAEGVENFYKVKIRAYFKNKFPKEEYVNKLNCNTKSLLLPEELIENTDEPAKPAASKANVDDAIENFINGIVGK